MANLTPPTPSPGSPVDVAAALARIDERLAALEAALAVRDEAAGRRQEDIDRLAWAVTHGRKRPW